MKINTDVETMILDFTRQGKKAQYILMGFTQFARWEKELEQKGMESPLASDGRFMGCQIIICSSDIIEVVTSPADQYRLLSRAR
ncbi:MAG: hypothetical protein CVV44_16020 [Spirochaetae bacterium HGW-Spirochaetae-1]|jgi:hypothetical protein|nr:MAG: hypothetical protein CVV44_16020 [Spirochaetae bacterium HGW-Spirochaetae-1]